MSKVAIAGNASGTGTFTIAAPNSNTDRTLTLPDEAGTVLTSASSIIPSRTDYAFWSYSGYSTGTSASDVVIGASPSISDITLSGITQSSGVFTVSQAGVYIINFSYTAQAPGGSSIVERHFGARILVNNALKSLARDQVSWLEGDNSFGCATASWVGVLAANDQIKFVAERSYTDGNIYIGEPTHGNIVRISA